MLQGYNFKTFNILSNERIRQWLKFYSNWPTFPQIFVNKKFIGGVDIVKDLVNDNELDSLLPETAKKMNSAEKLKKAVSASNVLLLIEGGADSPENDTGKEFLKISKANFKDFAVVNSKELDQEAINYLKESHILSPINAAFIKQQPILTPDDLHTYIQNNASSIDKPKSE